MADAPLRRMMRHIHHLAGAPSAATDRQLLERFAADRAPDAFAALVERHGPLVLGVCRRVLRHEQDAEDAFQATFHVLARKAGGVRWHESVANWLYEVARRVAHKARAGSLRRQNRERSSADLPEPASPPEAAWQELRQVLDEELDRLPRRYREPLLLCYLEGKTRDEAAQELGWSVGAVKGRLERGREMLRQRLVKRGLSLSAALFGAMLAEGAAPAAIPAPLADAAVNGAIAGTMSGMVATLAKGAMQTMFWTKMKMLAIVLLAVGSIGVGFGAVVLRAMAGPSVEAAAEPTKPAAKNAETATAPALPEKYLGVKALVSFRDLHDVDVLGRLERERRWKEKAEALQKSGLVVLRRVGHHSFLVDARDRDPADLIKGLPHQLGAIVFKNGHFREAVPYQFKQDNQVVGVWYFPEACARLNVFLDDEDGGDRVARVERKAKEWTEKFAKQGIRVKPCGGCNNGPVRCLRLEPGERMTLLEIFLLTEADFKLTDKKPH